MCVCVWICAPGGVLLKRLLDWWQLRFVEYDKKAYTAMKSDSPELHPHYWDAVSNVHELALRFQCYDDVIVAT